VSDGVDDDVDGVGSAVGDGLTRVLRNDVELVSSALELSIIGNSLVRVLTLTFVVFSSLATFSLELKLSLVSDGTVNLFVLRLDFNALSPLKQESLFIFKKKGWIQEKNVNELEIKSKIVNEIHSKNLKTKTSKLN
jgi:hypothetical protein